MISNRLAQPTGLAAAHAAGHSEMHQRHDADAEHDQPADGGEHDHDYLEHFVRLAVTGASLRPWQSASSFGRGLR